MSKIIFYSNTNSNGKNDATGAFVPEAKAFAKYYGVPPENVVGVNCKLPPIQRRKAVIKKLKQAKDFEVLMFFGHGWPDGIQFGFNRANIDELASAIDFVDGMKIGIFACLTAENDTRDNNIDGLGVATDGGFADKLRDVLNVEYGWTGWVDAHKTAGHATWNPYVVRFKAGQHLGGQWIITPGTDLWKHWVRALANNDDDMRYRFFTMFGDDIKVELSPSSD